jgi:hypothetical protein
MARRQLQKLQVDLTFKGRQSTAEVVLRGIAAIACPTRTARDRVRRHLRAALPFTPELEQSCVQLVLREAAGMTRDLGGDPGQLERAVR